MEHIGILDREKESTSTSTERGTKCHDWVFAPVTDEEAVAAALGEMVEDLESIDGFMDYPETLRLRILGYSCQLWELVIEGAVRARVITTISLYDKGSVFEVVALTGRGLEEWLPLLEQCLVYHGKETFKCKYISMEGRRGWLKRLARFHWREVSVRMIKEF